jgi:hypothetical protein
MLARYSATAICVGTLLLATGCGLSFTGSAASDAGPGQGATEPRVTTVSCGTVSCLADHQACCVGPGYSACVDPDAGGCARFAANAGDPAAPPPLECMTYRNCNGEQACCYRPDAGSRCAGSCADGAEQLCQVGTDECGGNANCESLASSPLPGMGHCVKLPKS